ncbi:hypothetical protein [Natronobacterium texcoconense]|uniref:Uncharacterized protein n=1 Tax=Natronobacterium texcoconense TaxID=1095778 RepID=A0A1H1B315_NATTX|nr:hypothetical protein [Natronobacterium texcoconense]SDQ46310.1 hypothetical protein SAMN04489842_0905 [Natronobacterium texcoconense]
MTETDEVRDQVTEILNEADTVGESVTGSSDGSGGEEFVEAAERASDLLESTEPGTLLEAVGLETLPDGTEPDSIPQAIVEGDADAVEDLERLLRLGNLANRVDEGMADAAIGGLRTAVEAEADSESSGEDEVGDERSDEGAPAESDGDRTEDDETGDDGGETEMDLGERLRSSLRETVTEFGDEVEQVQQQLEGVTADDDGEEGGTAESEADEIEDETEGEAAEDDLLEPDLGSGDDRSSGGARRHSTMAPSPSERPDMKAVSRFSTMPDKE